MACIARSLEQPTAIYGITPMINGTAGSRHPSRRSSSPWPRPPLATASATGPFSLFLPLHRGPSRGAHRLELGSGHGRVKKPSLRQTRLLPPPLLLLLASVVRRSSSPVFLRCPPPIPRFDAYHRFQRLPSSPATIKCTIRTKRKRASDSTRCAAFKPLYNFIFPGRTVVAPRPKKSYLLHLFRGRREGRYRIVSSNRIAIARKGIDEISVSFSLFSIEGRGVRGV